MCYLNVSLARRSLGEGGNALNKVLEMLFVAAGKIHEKETD
jgi:hypothetical protein